MQLCLGLWVLNGCAAWLLCCRAPHGEPWVCGPCYGWCYILLCQPCIQQNMLSKSDALLISNNLEMAGSCRDSATSALQTQAAMHSKLNMVLKEGGQLGLAPSRGGVVGWPRHLGTMFLCLDTQTLDVLTMMLQIHLFG